MFFTTTGYTVNEDLWDPANVLTDSDIEGFVLTSTPIPVKSLFLGQPIQPHLTLTERPPSQPLAMSYINENLSSNTHTLKIQRVSKLQDSLFTGSLITLTALNVGDYLSTLQALKHEDLKEANPVMKPFTKNIYLFTAVKFGVTAFNVCLLNKLYRKNKPLAWILSAAANFAMSYVVANNIHKTQDIR